MKPLIAVSVFVVALLVGGAVARAEEKARQANVKRLEALKGLAGEWVEVGKDGKPTDKVISSIRVTAGGSAVQETLFPGGDKEMVTMYHLDGDDLILTHYCMLGNQPRMRAEPGTDVNKIAFKFVGGTNLKSNDEHHMHQATLTIEGKDRLKATWVSCQDGKPCHEANFDLVRKQK
jgi:hypothetical protein